jgi:hypothetical protein
MRSGLSLDIACCQRVSDRLVENLKNKAIACCRRVIALFRHSILNLLNTNISLCSSLAFFTMALTESLLSEK